MLEEARDRARPGSARAAADVRGRGRRLDRRRGRRRAARPRWSSPRTELRTTSALEPRVVLVHGRPSSSPELGDRLGPLRDAEAPRTPVSSCALGRRLTRVEPGSGGARRWRRSSPTATVVSTVGNAPNPALAGSAVRARRCAAGSRPDATFARARARTVWALGDCASIIDPKTGRPMPATAQHAIREGPHAARNVLAALDGTPQTPFDYEPAGHARLARPLQGRGRGPRHQGLRASSPGSSGGATTCCGCPPSSGGSAWRSTGRSSCFLAHDIVEINMRRTRTRPGESVGEMEGEPVSVGARPDTSDEIVI